MGWGEGAGGMEQVCCAYVDESLGEGLAQVLGREGVDEGHLLDLARLVLGLACDRLDVRLLPQLRLGRGGGK